MNRQIPHTEERHRFINAISRRGLLGRFIGLIAALIGAILVYPLAGYTIFPALKRRSEEWVDILDPTRLKPLEPKSIEVVMSLKDGWLKSTAVKSVWAVRKGDEIVIYSPLCTHLGCGYRWEAERQVFFCPCHGSVFNIDGRVLAGPAPRPLDTLPVKVENGRLWIIYKEFKAGTPKKIEL
jgi:menaquinol-cytochrome c reductase iron-sulfur subunit